MADAVLLTEVVGSSTADAGDQIKLGVRIELRSGDQCPYVS